MKKKPIIILLTFFLILLLAIFFLSNSNKASTNNSMLTPTKALQSDSLCNSKDLDTKVLFEGAAGNVYGTFSIRNKSPRSCNIEGENFIQLSYDSTINNLKVNSNANTQNKTFVLLPNQTLYSLIHFPNGAQCAADIKQINVSYFYISNGEKLIFNDISGKNKFFINGCNGENEITNMDLSQLSYQKPN